MTILRVHISYKCSIGVFRILHVTARTNTPSQMSLLRAQMTLYLFFLLLLYDTDVTRLVQIFDAAHGHQPSVLAYKPRIDFSRPSVCHTLYSHDSAFSTTSASRPKLFENKLKLGSSIQVKGIMLT